MKNGEEEEITEEQRNRAEANRLAALAKRKDRISEPNNNSWKLFKCRKLSGNVYFHKPQTPAPVNPPPKPCAPSPPPQRFKARLEICSPDSFCVTPVPLQGFIYPGEKNCLEKLRDCLSCVRIFFKIVC